MKISYRSSFLKVKKIGMKSIIKPFQRFVHLEASSGLVLILSTVLALAWANLNWPIGYEHFWHLPLSISFSQWDISKSLHFWINDALMVVFFFVVGLEIKREVMIGELASFKQASLPFCAALGGILCPALFYIFFNPLGGPELKGWAIPTATDIAFALGVLTLLGKSVPIGLKVFLTALAIVDDLGAILIIALFYTDKVSFSYLIVGLGIFLFLFWLNRRGVRSIWPYLISGFFLWMAILGSGIHATVAGVLLAMTIPIQGKRVDSPSPLSTLEHVLHPWVSFLILPLFALANAGFTLTGSSISQTLPGSVVLGILMGLIFGKQIGITLFSWIAVKSGFSSLPNGVRWSHIYGASWLGGIGFTMSLFIANLSFLGTDYFEQAQIGILFASVIAGLIGWFILFRILKRENTPSNIE